MNKVRKAVILMAGMGSRLRVPGQPDVPKPLTPILGKALIAYNLEALKSVGIETVYAVVGFEEEIVRIGTRPLVPDGLNLEFVHNDEWRKQNGVSVLAAAGAVSGSFLLCMSDHLYDCSILEMLTRREQTRAVELAVDRKIESIFDLDDAMKVVTEKDRVIRLGKKLTQFDAIDTGMFLCSPTIFHYLERAKKNGDCSLAEGVQLAANDAQVTAVDIGSAWWQDVDTPEMLAAAEEHLRAARVRTTTAAR
jgi:1L-myo-inositol 1-phosphate cytidylyltransferase